MYVITNGNTYITKSRSGKVGKTSNILEAEWFDSIDIANIIFQHAPGKTKGYYIKDLETCYVYKRYTNGKSNYSAPRLGYINFWSKQRKYNFCFIIALLRKVDNFSM